MSKNYALQLTMVNFAYLYVLAVFVHILSVLFGVSCRVQYKLDAQKEMGYAKCLTVKVVLINFVQHIRYNKSHSGF